MSDSDYRRDERMVRRYEDLCKTYDCSCEGLREDRKRIAEFWKSGSVDSVYEHDVAQDAASRQRTGKKEKHPHRALSIQFHGSVKECAGQSCGSEYVNHPYIGIHTSVSTNETSAGGGKL